METAFTPVTSFSGGLLIGLAAVLLMAGPGRILGASGLVSGLLSRGAEGEREWRLALLAGMVTGPLAIYLIRGAMPVVEVPVTWPMLVIGGLIVGMGVTIGSGCTSGHGVCGLSRLSPRSLVAVLSFMAAAGVTVFLIRHVIGG